MKNQVKEMSFEDFAKEYDNVSFTENGAAGKATTKSALLDMNFMVSSLRDRAEAFIVESFVKAYYEDRRYAVKWLFFVRDILEGLGERRTFRVCLKYMAKSHPAEAKAIMKLIPEYGRYDDLLTLVDTELSDEVCAFLYEQLQQDVKACEAGEQISLLAKWLPSCNTSSSESRRLASIIRKKFGMTEKEYRKTLAMLRRYSNVVEVQISANEWDQVDYERVPAKAGMKYESAFTKHDLEGRIAYFEKVIAGDAKLNSNGLMPYEIAGRVCKVDGWYHEFQDDLLAELLWDKIVKEGFDNNWGFDDCIVVADGSGSMFSHVSGDNHLHAIEVCNALAIYFAQQLQGVFHDKVITFSEHPQYIDLSKAKSLKEKLEIMYAYNEIANTNIEAVFDMLLAMAVSNQVPADQIPKQVLIISDMEFDAATGGGRHSNHAFTEDLFEQIAARYEEAGYQIPRLIFWNVCGRTDTIPAVEGDQGICLLSGFAVNAMKVATHRDVVDPYEALLKTLDAPRYDVVDAALDLIAS